MFGERGNSIENVRESLDNVLVTDELYMSGHPIASMSTIPHSIGVDIFTKTLERNAGRLHTFKGSAKVEQEVIGMLSDMVHLDTPIGTTTSGGTESNIIAILAAREFAKKGKGTPEIIAPRTVHSSVEKAAWLTGTRLVKTRVDRNYKAAPKAIEKAVNENTVGIIATAGTTYLGQIDPIEKISEIAAEYKIPFHVDAAFGGFVIPFLRDLGMCKVSFDFENRGVTSMSIDAHKMGLAPIPSGSILFRFKKHLKLVTKKAPYLPGASSKQASILGTRPAAPILATWAVMKHLGKEGYRKVVADCMRRTELAADRLETNPLLSQVIKPVMNIIGIRSKERPIKDIAEEMEVRGWRMAASPVPKSIRLVMMPHVTDGAINVLFNALDEISTTIPAS
ncbi:MAG: tyrosine decarboxylase MfnA [Candidatus Thorarchaeota archaeon]